MSTIKNAILTRFQGGYRTDTDSGSISANGRRESFLSLPSTSNSAATTAAIDEYIDDCYCYDELKGVMCVNCRIRAALAKEEK